MICLKPLEGVNVDNLIIKYGDELARLIKTGQVLYISMQYEFDPELIKEEFKEIKKSLVDPQIKSPKDLPSFSNEYQSWYSEAQALVRQLLPDRLGDFCSYYEQPKSRKELTYESYRISDFLISLCTKDAFGDVVVGKDAAIPKFAQQIMIVKAIRRRFKSSLFDIKGLVQADLFDSELDAARALVKHGFTRAGGALAGVVMEKHLAQVCANHAVKLRNKSPTITDYNNALKDNGVIDVPQWRSNEYLRDIRNLCDHSKSAEPTDDQVNDLVTGVMKITKTLA